jgi:regulator of cell morphogenesis and NO signaling
MSSVSLDTPIGQLVTERPSRSLIFERLAIDYCCGGRTTLREACQSRGLDPVAVLYELAGCDTEENSVNQTDWSQAPLSALADHIVATHHQYLREVLPRLTLLIDKVVRAHGERHSELLRLQERFRFFRCELEAHMAKEERVLFPMCRELEAVQTLPGMHCGSVDNPIRVVMREHDDAGSTLAAMRELTHDFTPPEDACITYRTMLEGLADLERDMHLHVHKENNILFPRASAAEACRAAGPAALNV